ncbi:MAG: M24 family metallopeptidase [Anaerolineae bacterium]|nr:M24 family metallopeptidase [Anaerolineae bacterium]
MSRLNALKHKILPLRQQLPLRKKWLEEKLDTVIPTLLQRENVDMWLLICREYNEDPVISTLTFDDILTARRTTVLVFSRNSDGTVDRFSADRYGRDFFEPKWNPDEESQWDCIARIVKERDPQTIALNYSDTFAFGDGISHTHYQKLASALGTDTMKRVVSGERLAVGWLERRTLSEMIAYPALIEIGHAIIAEAFSTNVIHIGVTTTEDIQWWLRQTIHDMGLHAWFPPDCQIQAQGQSFGFLQEQSRTLILPGDLLWCDVGFRYLGLCTDQQEVAYVLKPHESDASQGLKAALARGNRTQDILMEEMQVGRTGNDVLQSVLARTAAENIHAMIYTHPLGNHGHAAGPTIGLWDKQSGVSGNGDYELFDNTAYSIELNIRTTIPEWDNQEIYMNLEQDAIMQNDSMHWLHGRQSNFHLLG